MNRIKMSIYALIGAVISVLIWSLIGGCQSPDADTAPKSEGEPAVIMEETEEELIEEGVLPPPELISPEPAAAEGEEVEAPPASETGESLIYTVEKGDTLWSISRHFGVSMQQLQDANGLADPDRISVGQELRIR